MSEISQTRAASLSESERRRSTSEEKASTPGKSKSSKSTGRQKEPSMFQKEWNSWRNYIRKHRRDIREAKPSVDDQPPRLNIPQLYDQEMLKTEDTAIFLHYATNPEIVKVLHHVSVFGGKTQTLQYDYRKLLPSSNFHARRCQAVRNETANKHLKQMIEATGPRLMRVEEYAEFWKRMENLMESNSQFPLFWKITRKRRERVQVEPSRQSFRQYVTEKSSKYPDKRPRVFFEVSIRNVGAIGKMVAVLYSDYVPMTVKNFLAFCDPKAQLTYRGCFFYLIFQNFFCQTGDVVENKGFGGTSIYGPYFGDEDHTLHHGERGVLTMFNTIPNRNQCQFLITFRELKTLDGKNVAFGKIVRGLHVLDAIESVGSKTTGRPKVDIYISDCDEI